MMDSAPHMYITVYASDSAVTMETEYVAQPDTLLLSQDEVKELIEALSKALTDAAPF